MFRCIPAWLLACMSFDMEPIGSRKEFLIWIAAALAASGALALVLKMERQTVSDRKVTQITGVPENGQKLFFGSKGCYICHSIGGAGGRLAPDLTGRRPGSPAMSWLMTVLWNHAPGMWRRIRLAGQSYPHLDQQEMADMLAYLYEAGNTDPPGNSTVGGRVFEEKGCVRCHTVNGRGGTGGPDLSQLLAKGDSADWIQAMWNHAQQMVQPVTQLVGQWPQFDGVSMNNLIAFAGSNATQVKPIIAAVRGRPESGWVVFQAKCMQCHAIRGQGGTKGPELGPENDLPLSKAQFAATLWNHAPAMMKQMNESKIELPKLEKDDIVQLASFLANLRYYEPAGTRFVGERVFTERGCAHCHGPKGDGTKLAPPLRKGVEALTMVSFTTALWQHGPKMVDKLEQAGMSWPVLKPADVGDLIAFLNAAALEK
jgi:mono/diheme cytochrome c family protein